jgi:hypothetical protein
MKTISKYMVISFLFSGLLLISLKGSSQDTKLSRQERKEVEKAQLAANFYVLDSLLNVRSFVLEANYLQNQYGDMVYVASMLNFIKVDGSKGVLQTGSDLRNGYNGVGGVTAEGNIGTWEIRKNAKSMSYSLRFNIVTNLGNFDIFMTVNSDTRASATISGYTSAKLTWNGYLKTINNSRVFKGQNTI